MPRRPTDSGIVCKSTLNKIRPTWRKWDAKSVLLHQHDPGLWSVIFIWELKEPTLKSRVQLLTGCIEFSWSPIFHFPGVESETERQTRGLARPQLELVLIWETFWSRESGGPTDTHSGQSQSRRPWQLSLQAGLVSYSKKALNISPPFWKTPAIFRGILRVIYSSTQKVRFSPLPCQ